MISQRFIATLLKLVCFCRQLTKAYVVKTSCGHLLLIAFVTYMLKINLLVNIIMCTGFGTVCTVIVLCHEGQLAKLT